MCDRRSVRCLSLSRCSRQGDAGGHSVRDEHIQVRRVGRMRGRTPAVAVKRPPHIVVVGSVRASQRCQAFERRLKPRRAHEGGVLLYWRA
eukprot:796892-Pleurochrysis_carterae.AAC.1